MISIGRRQRLTIARATPVGMFLTDGTHDVLLPRKYVPSGLNVGDDIEVFVYLDGEERPVSTTLTPLAEVGQVATMRCVASSGMGAFMDWGLEKDLLIPGAEQRDPIQVDGQYVVWVGFDELSGRLYGSTKLEKHTIPAPPELVGKEVTCIPFRRQTHGIICVVDDQYLGMLFESEVKRPIQMGRSFKGYVRKVREDGRIAIALTPVGYQASLEAGPALLNKLQKAGGFLPFNDRTPPETIFREFGLSKGSFKKLIGTLQREGKLTIESHGIRASDQ